MKTIFVIRHGQTEWNLERRMQGRLDSPLTHQGTEQAHGHGILLKSLVPVQEMYVSPSGRTRETAYILNSYVRAHVIYEEALLERDLGIWSGLTVDELEDSFPRAWQERLDDPFHHRPPEGENLADMSDRCNDFLYQMLHGAAERIALVTHQVMSRVILGKLLGLTQTETTQVIHPNDVIYEVRVHEEGTDVYHYRSGHGPFDGLLRHGDDETIPELTTT